MSLYAPIAIDLSVMAIVLVSGLLAYARGFAREAATLASLIIASLATYHLFSVAMPIAETHIKSTELAAAASISAIFIITLVASLSMGHFIANLISSSEASRVDRWLGLFFGIARGALIVVVLWMLVSYAVAEIDLPEPLNKARLLPMVRLISNWILTLLPSSFQDNMVFSALSDQTQTVNFQIS